MRGGAPDGAIDAIERASLLLALRVAYSERQAGYDEHSVALLQVRSTAIVDGAPLLRCLRGLPHIGRTNRQPSADRPIPAAAAGTDRVQLLLPR